MKQVIVTISPTGEIEVKGAGFKGKECKKHIDAVSKALGTVTKSCKLPEYFQQQTTNQKIGT